MNAALTHERGNLARLARIAARNATARMLSLIDEQKIKVASHRANIVDHAIRCGICQQRDSAT